MAEITVTYQGAVVLLILATLTKPDHTNIVVV